MSAFEKQNVSEDINSKKKATKVAFYFYQACLIASTGQTPAQVPHSVHASGSI